MDNLDKLRRVSAVLQWACTFYLVTAPLVLAGLWLNFDRFGPQVEALRSLPIQLEYVGPMNLWLGFFLSGVPVGLVMVGVWRLRRLFGLYRTGVLFSAESAGHLHAFAVLLFSSVLLSPFTRALTSVVLTMGNPPGQRTLALSFGSTDLSKLFIAGVLLAVAWILREGYRLARENEAFV
ncbi:MAG: hypothetical protein RLZZ385_1326 [Pseudomonadota bacterium]|jgi:hypothetical protein